MIQHRFKIYQNVAIKTVSSYFTDTAKRLLLPPTFTGSECQKFVPLMASVSGTRESEVLEGPLYDGDTVLLIVYEHYYNVSRECLTKCVTLHHLRCYNLDNDQSFYSPHSPCYSSCLLLWVKVKQNVIERADNSQM